jgi:hypothetical protein
VTSSKSNDDDYFLATLKLLTPCPGAELVSPVTDSTCRQRDMMLSHLIQLREQQMQQYFPQVLYLCQILLFIKMGTRWESIEPQMEASASPLSAREELERVCGMCLQLDRDAGFNANMRVSSRPWYLPFLQKQLFLCLGSTTP